MFSLRYPTNSNGYGMRHFTHTVQGRIDGPRSNFLFRHDRCQHFGSGQADTYVSIDETIDLKIAALRAHVSQITGWDPEPRMREWAAAAAQGKEMQYAEVFRVVTLEGDEEWSKWKGKVVGRQAALTEGETPKPPETVVED